MAIQFPSLEWVEALRDALNASEKYGDTAKHWEGDLLFEILPEGDLKETTYLFIGLWHGKCTNVAVVNGLHERKAEFTLTATLGNFIKVLTHKLDPMQAMLTRRLQVRGNLIMMMRNVPTVLEFVRTAASIQTEFPAL